MSRWVPATLVTATVCMLGLTTSADDGFVELFNGRDLSGWINPPGGKWTVDDGVIALQRDNDGREHNHVYLWTEETYGDFILELEFKIPQRANSGIFLRTADINDPVFTGLEVQIANSHGRDRLTRGGTAGAIYDCLAPTSNPIGPPGTWNQFRILCQDNVIQVELNGQQIINMDLDQWTQPHRNPDGTENKYPTALKDFARVGHIGLQDHGLPVWYRNIRIKRLGSDAREYTMTPDAHGQVVKDPEGRTVFRYMTTKPADTQLTANSVCCLYPVRTPSGEDVVEFAPDDHRHHRGLFLAWHTILGDRPADFWGWGEYAPTEDRVIENRDVRLVQADSRQAIVEVHNEWTVEGETLISERTTITTRAVGPGTPKRARVIDLHFHLTPHQDLTLQRSAFGGLCVKARKDGQSHFSNPEGRVDLPAPHHLQPDSDWPAAAWYNYATSLSNGKAIGVAVIDHPENPPTRWHNLVSISMINPCIVAPAAVELARDKPLELRYRVVVYDGAEPTRMIERLSEQFRGAATSRRGAQR